MKKWANIKDVVGQPLEAFGEIVSSGEKIILVFRDSFVVISSDWPSYAESISDARACEEEPGDALDEIGERMLIDLAIATPQEVAALVAARDAMRAQSEEKRIQDGIAAEREQYERLRQKFGNT